MSLLPNELVGKNKEIEIKDLLEEEEDWFEEELSASYDYEEDLNNDRPLSTQEIIDNLEERIKMIEDIPKSDVGNLDNLEKLYRTVRLLCVILAVELGKTISDDSILPLTDPPVYS